VSPEPFGIYVHWPFCAAKCPYCDFNSHVRSRVDDSEWVNGVVSELEHVAGLQGPSRPPVDTIFFGGGTPSLMRGKSVATVMDAIAKLWPVTSAVEITLESNPASADAQRFRDYRDAGVNRLSLGAQALNDADLKMLGRLHGVAEAKAAVRFAQACFDDVSMDLIYVRPQQTAEQWRCELREALALGTDHLSLYQLTIEPATPFAMLARTGALVVPDDDAAAALYEVTQEITEAAGMFAYEISNHAKSGAECRHNLLYWRYGDYAGVGPGAHGRLTLSGHRIATATERLPERWLARIETEGHALVERHELSDENAAHEHLLMNRRLTEGLDVAGYERRWGLSLNRSRIDSLQDERLLEFSKGRLAATQSGRLVLNSLIAALAD